MEDKYDYAAEIKDNSRFLSKLSEATKDSLKTLRKHQVSGGIL